MQSLNNIVITGARGLLGGALVDRARKLVQIAADERGTADEQLAGPCIVLESRHLLARIKAGADVDVRQNVVQSGARQHWLYAAGIIDPRADPTALDWVNAEAPQQLLDILGRAAESTRLEAGSVRLVTFGSALEERAGISAANPYIRSKAQLYQQFCRHRDQGAAASPVAWSHIRLHTLYGRGRPPPFMFLGQMEAALRQKAEFAMSAGAQLREYHHADDVAENVLYYLAAVPRTRHAEMITLGHGRPIRIGELAGRTFAHFHCKHLLKLGAIAAQPGEVFEAAAPPSPFVVANRDPVEGIIDWLERLGIRSSAE